MAQLDTLKLLLGTPPISDDVLAFYLSSASDIICDIRNSDTVETKYLNTQIKIAIELFNKAGVEGQIGHSENSISRTYETGDISNGLLSQITPIAKTHISELRVVNV